MKFLYVICVLCGLSVDGFFCDSIRSNLYVNLYMKVNQNKLNKSPVKNIVENYKPKSINQKLYVEALSNNSIPIVLGVGSAGTGKTLFACQYAIEALQTGLVSKIVITRPLISVDQEPMGFLPGSLEQKMGPWTRPIFDLLEEFYTTSQIERMIEDSIIEISPLAYMRGRTFRSAFIIADEVQNISPSQMFMLLTRLGEGSRIAITGDLKQSDFSGRNGLVDFVEKLKNTSHDNGDIKMIELGNDDIQRSAIVQKIVSMYANVDSKKDVQLEENKEIHVEENKEIHVEEVKEDKNDCAIIPKSLYTRFL